MLTEDVRNALVGVCKKQGGARTLLTEKYCNGTTYLNLLSGKNQYIHVEVTEEPDDVIIEDIEADPDEEIVI